MIRISLAQLVCEKGAIAENLKRVSDHLIEAEKRRIDIVGFPEMNLTGYADPTRYPEAVVRLDGPEVERLLKITRG